MIRSACSHSLSRFRNRRLSHSIPLTCGFSVVCAFANVLFCHLFRSLAHPKGAQEEQRKKEEEKAKEEHRPRLHSQCLVGFGPGLHPADVLRPHHPYAHARRRYASALSLTRFSNPGELFPTGPRGCAVKAEPEDSCLTSQDAVEHAQKMKRDLLEKLEELAEQLPPNTLDELIDELGGPENVAEVQNVDTFFFKLDAQ